MKKNLTFSGTDTLAFIILPNTSPIVLGSITTLSYSSYRIKKPVNTLGRILVKGIAKGNRVIAGTLIFTLINQHWVNELLDVVPWLKENAEDIIYSDELPLFDIMIVSANEYGNYVSMMIYGVDLTDEAQVLSINDMYTENTFSFVAREIRPFSNKADNFKNGLYHSNKAFASVTTKLNLDYSYELSPVTNNDVGDYEREFNTDIFNKLKDLGYDIDSTTYDKKVKEYAYDIINKMNLGSDIDISYFIEDVLPNINQDFINNIEYYAVDDTKVYSKPGSNDDKDVVKTIYANDRTIIIDKTTIDEKDYYLTLDGWIENIDVNIGKSESYIYDLTLDGKSIREKVNSYNIIVTDKTVTEFLNAFNVKFNKTVAMPMAEGISEEEQIPIEYVTNILFTNKEGEFINTIKKFTYVGDVQNVNFTDRRNTLVENIDVLQGMKIIIASNQIDDSVCFKVIFTNGGV